MQWMEPNTTAIGVVYRISNQVVDIYEHCRDHNEISQLPVFSKEEAYFTLSLYSDPITCSDPIT